MPWPVPYVCGGSVGVRRLRGAVVLDAADNPVGFHRVLLKQNVLGA